MHGAEVLCANGELDKFSAINIQTLNRNRLQRLFPTISGLIFMFVVVYK